MNWTSIKNYLGRWVHSRRDLISRWDMLCDLCERTNSVNLVDLTIERKEPKEVVSEPDVFHLDAVTHQAIIEFDSPFSYEAMRVSRAVLKPEVTTWLDENTTKWTLTPSTAWNFGVDLKFEKDIDAVAFKLRWL